MQKERRHMKRKLTTEAKLICPECSAVIVTPRPEVLVWELCPACKSHIWDTYDLMLAEVVQVKTSQGEHPKPVMRAHIN